uniref:Uncharacterized protein n=1 Tax=Triticum urartu TaxID=4572 RepID=A0A8R7UH12_TRIUA
MSRASFLGSYFPNRSRASTPARNTRNRARDSAGSTVSRTGAGRRPGGGRGSSGSPGSRGPPDPGEERAEGEISPSRVEEGDEKEERRTWTAQL